MITFIESKFPNYTARTFENVQQTDITVALAFDFDTAGEKVTKKYTNELKRLYIPINLNDPNGDIKRAVIHLQHPFYADTGFKVNIAGNGLYTCIDFGLNQNAIDRKVGGILSALFSDCNLIEVRSGGQTGVDEIGVKWADHFNIKAICHFPRGYLFRDYTGNDIWDKKLFLSRFECLK